MNEAITGKVELNEVVATMDGGGAVYANQADIGLESLNKGTFDGGVDAFKNIDGTGNFVNDNMPTGVGSLSYSPYLGDVIEEVNSDTLGDIRQNVYTPEDPPAAPVYAPVGTWSYVVDTNADGDVTRYRLVN